MLIVCFSVFLPPTGPNSSTIALKRRLWICLINNLHAKSFCVSREINFPPQNIWFYFWSVQFTSIFSSLHECFAKRLWTLLPACVVPRNRVNPETGSCCSYSKLHRVPLRVDTFPSMRSVQQSWRIAAVLHYRTHNLVLWCWGREYRLSSSGKAWNRKRSIQNIFFKECGTSWKRAVNTVI